MLGGAAFLADSVLTPAVSISSAVEGLKTLPALEHLFTENKDLTMMITAVIIVILFAVQSRGTESIGKVFGSVVMVWFAFLAIVGVVAIGNDWSVLAALNPYYGIKFLFSPNNATGLALMGTVFLSTTGAEALYSDMGHVGRGNIYFTWPFIKVALVLNYFGQGAWMLRNQNNPELADAEGINPFFQMMDPNVRYVAVVLSVTAGIIASQALITGAFTMVSEATGLNWMPHLQVCYPARTRGQLYIPVINVVLCVATLAVLLLFRDSEHISAAYGLALTITMDHHHDPAGHLPVAPQQQVRRRCVHHRVPGDPGPVLRRLDGQVPARRLVHAAAHAGDPHDHVHVERGHQAGALAASAHDAEGLPPRAGQAARR